MKTLFTEEQRQALQEVVSRGWSFGRHSGAAAHPSGGMSASERAKERGRIAQAEKERAAKKKAAPAAKAASKPPPLKHATHHTAYKDPSMAAHRQAQAKKTRETHMKLHKGRWVAKESVFSDEERSGLLTLIERTTK